MAMFLGHGHALNFVTVIVAPVVFVLGFAYAIHCVSAVEERLAQGLARGAAVDLALRDAAGPITLNAALEAAGFLSLAMSSIDAIRLFGLYAALGIVLAWLGTLVAVPAALELIPGLAVARGADDGGSRLVTRLARFNLRHRRALLWGGAALTAVALVCASRLEVGTDYLGVLPGTHPVVHDFKRVAMRFDGIVPLQILIESDVPGHFKDPAQLAHVAAFEQWLEAQPEIGGALSLVDYLGVLYRTFVPDAPAGQQVPPTREMTDQLLLLGAGNSVERFADSRFGATLLHARTTLVETADLARLVARIERRLAELPPHLHGHVTGSSVLLARAINDITWGQVTSLAATALAIYAVLTLIFGSLRIGALALIPMFHGLTARQARTAAMLGSIHSYAPGERVFQVGDSAKEIFVVIEGEVAATVPHPDGDSNLRHFRRGDLLGAASLFHGSHFANADTLGPVRVLRLGEACLGQIQQRYPRIGAQLYRNLSAIMAERLADFAVRV